MENEEMGKEESPSKNLTFGMALAAVKNGLLIGRKNWNGKGQFVFMRPEDELSVDFIIEKVKSLPAELKRYYMGHFSHTSEEQINGKGPDSVKVKFSAYLCLKSADGSIINGWVASTTDMLAEDWEIL